MARILLTGGSGRLGTAIRKHLVCFAPGRSLLDICDPRSVKAAMKKYDPEIIIHAAAFADALGCERDKQRAWDTNVTGTENLLYAAPDRRFVYISTDYVFDGESGCYREDDVPNPVNFYGLTKLAGELLASTHSYALILRAPFRQDGPWRYPRAFSDQWTSCAWASVRAPEIVQAALGNMTGVLHIGSSRKSILSLAREVSPEVGETTRATFSGVRIPRDTSLDSSKWHSYLAASERSSQLVGTWT